MTQKKILEDYQAGFRFLKSTTKQLFNLKKVLSKYGNSQTSIHSFCRFYQDIYDDSINRKQMWKHTQQNGILEKLIINMAKHYTKWSKCKIRINNEYTQEFTINKGI